MFEYDALLPTVNLQSYSDDENATNCSGAHYFSFSTWTTGWASRKQQACRSDCWPSQSADQTCLSFAWTPKSPVYFPQVACPCTRPTKSASFPLSARSFVALHSLFYHALEAFRRALRCLSAGCFLMICLLRCVCHLLASLSGCLRCSKWEPLPVGPLTRLCHPCFLSSWIVVSFC